MQISEMRSALDLENIKRGKPAFPESTPAWVIQNIYEKRNGLVITPLPKDIAVRGISSLVTPSSGNEKRRQRAQQVLDEIQAQNEAEEQMLLRLKAEAALLLL